VRRYLRKPFPVKVWLGTAGFIPQGPVATAGYSGYYWRTVVLGLFLASCPSGLGIASEADFQILDFV
jgi:hypothetical protein